MTSPPILHTFVALPSTILVLQEHLRPLPIDVDFEPFRPDEIPLIEDEEDDELEEPFRPDEIPFIEDEEDDELEELEEPLAAKPLIEDELDDDFERSLDFDDDVDEETSFLLEADALEAAA